MDKNPNACKQHVGAKNNTIEEGPSKILESGSSLPHQVSISSTDSTKRMSNSSGLGKGQLNPPDAHATSQTSYSQLSQPLCLQTSGRTPLVQEREMKPLNMQIINSES